MAKKQKLKYVPPESLNRFVSDLIDATDQPRYKAAFLLMRWTGARIGEIVGVSTKDFLLDPVPMVRLRALKRRAEEYKFVPIPRHVWERARMWVDQDTTGMRVSRHVARKIMLRVCKRNGYPVEWAHPHVLRHSRAVELVARGVEPPVIARLLGHKSLSTVYIYMDLAPVDIYRRIYGGDDAVSEPIS